MSQGHDPTVVPPAAQEEREGQGQLGGHEKKRRLETPPGLAQDVTTESGSHTIPE